jgi:hypothetical protein
MPLQRRCGAVPERRRANFLRARCRGTARVDRAIGREGTSAERIFFTGEAALARWPGAMFAHPASRQRSDLPVQLDCRMPEDGMVAVDNLDETGMSGVLAAEGMARHTDPWNPWRHHRLPQWPPCLHRPGHALRRPPSRRTADGARRTAHPATRSTYSGVAAPLAMT